jgi:hypothetical protein
MGKVKQHLTSERPCVHCDALFPKERERLGYDTCLTCGETQARQKLHTVVPMHKSNYTVISNRAELLGINNKGGFFR